MAADRWLVVGLGNPEPEYAATRHNIGADAVRLLASRHGEALRRQRRARGTGAELRLADARVVAYEPDGYMNRCGDPVQAATRWFKVPVERLIVCHDDLDLDPGALRVKRGGGNAGHNGLRDIERALGRGDFLRVRIGIGRPPGRVPARDFVLGRFSTDERVTIDAGLDDVVDAVESLVTDGLEVTQNRYHARDRAKGGGRRGDESA